METMVFGLNRLIDLKMIYKIKILVCFLSSATSIIGRNFKTQSKLNAALIN